MTSARNRDAAPGETQPVMAHSSLTKRGMKSQTALILGAGWSWCGGLPLARELFDTHVAGYTADADWRSYQAWQARNRGAHAEAFLLETYQSEVDLVTPPLGRNQLALEALRRLPWKWAVEFVQVRLAYPVRGETRRIEPRYAPQLEMPTRSQAQKEFWGQLQQEHDVVAVITLNYDLLAERTLRPHAMARWPGGGFYYGGVTALAHRSGSPFGRDRRTDPTPDGRIPLFKLHGSLNWGVNATTMVVYSDLRGAFTAGGVAAIVPPLPEKEALPWLAPVWRGAAVELARADEWVVVGYSLPEYDHAVRQLLATAAGAGRLTKIVLHDPAAAALATRWAELGRHHDVVAARALDRR